MSTLIADCGSTKVEWAVIDCEHHSAELQPVIIHTGGFNAAVTPAEDIIKILREEFIPSITAKGIAAHNITQLHFYGAGCIGGDVNNTLYRILSEIMLNAAIELASDLSGAARALFSNNKGIACILGTGSNCGVYNGTDIICNTPPMGYILGDEGSGAVLGRNLINRIFKHPGYFSKEIIAEFNAEYNLSKTDIIERVYRRQGANRFLASFCPFLKKHLNEPAVYLLIADSFKHFLTANLPLDKSAKDLPIGFVGSIAHHFEPVLRTVCSDFGYLDPSILQFPLPRLISYHSARK